MNKQTLAFLIVAFLLFIFPAQAIIYVGGEGGTDSISKAIEKAKEKETIIVYEGIYKEDVVIDKPLILKAAGNVTIEALDDSQSVVWIKANNVVFSDFTVKGGHIGIHLDNVWGCVIENNSVFENDFGITLSFSSANSLINNLAFKNEIYGIGLEYSSNNTIENNTACENGRYGIGLRDSSNNEVSNNNVNKNLYGMFLIESGNNEIENNTACENEYDGFHLEDSSRNECSNNIANKNLDSGIELIESNNNKIKSNIGCENGDDGIFLGGSAKNEISNNTANKNLDGISLSISDNNKIKNNTACENGDDGIGLRNSSGNDVCNNIINKNLAGISLFNSDNNEIRNNTAYGNEDWGISLEDSMDNEVNNNIVNKNLKGILLSDSINNTIRKNTAYENEDQGISLRGNSSSNEVSNNIVNKNLDGILIIESNKNIIKSNIACENEDSGIVLQESSMNEVSNNIVNKNLDGILLLAKIGSIGNKIRNNIACENGEDGIHLEDSSENVISNNIVNKNSNSIVLMNSNINTIRNNAAYENRIRGIFLVNASKTEICNNIVNKNLEGIGLYSDSNHNIIINNNIVNNYKYQLRIQNSYHNRFNFNYWSDYGGEDIDKDDIGDEPYEIDKANKDPNPFMNYSGWLNVVITPEFWYFIAKKGDEIQKNFGIENRLDNKADVEVLLDENLWFEADVDGNGTSNKTFKNITSKSTKNITLQLNTTNLEGYILRKIIFKTEDYTKTTLVNGFVQSKIHNVEIEGVDFHRNVVQGQKNIFTVILRNYGDNDEFNVKFRMGYLFSVRDGELAKDLNKGIIPERLKSMLKDNDIPLSENATVTKRDNDEWTIMDEEKKKTYIVRKKDRMLNIYRKGVSRTVCLNENEARTILFKIDTSNLHLGINKGEVVVSKEDMKKHLNLTTFVASKLQASTLIMTNLKRMGEKWKNDNISEFEEKLIELSFHPNVNGIIVKVEDETNCSNLYDEWDNDKGSEKANEIAKAIKDLIDSKGKEYPNIEYLIIVGDDRIIPFYRIIDKTSESFIANSSYDDNWFIEMEYSYLFSIVMDAQLEGDLNNVILSGKLKERFKETEGITLSENAHLEKGDDNEWWITDGKTIYGIKKEDGTLYIFDYSKLNPDSTVGSALYHNMFLTDNLYAIEPLEWKTDDVTIPKLLISDIPVSRLVETPEEISATIETFYQKEYISPDKIFVTGYDFMSDSASDCRSILEHETEGNTTAVISENVTDDYFKNIVEELLNTSNDIVFIFQHAEHDRFKIPKYHDENENEDYGYISSQNISSADLNGSIVCSMGCHSGLNVPPNASIDDFDLAQAFAQKGVLAYIAPTGYSIGSGWTTSSHELLLSYFTKYLCEGKDVGTALTLAKQEYWATNYDFNDIDEKVLETTTLYGLPMVKIKMPYHAPAKTDSKIKIMNTDKEQRTIEKPDTLVIRPTHTLKSVSGDLYQYYITPGEELLSDPRKPVQPKEIRIFNPTSTKMLHGAVMTGGKYQIIESFRPLIEIPKQSPDQELKPVDIELDNWDPSPLFKINTITHPRAPMESRQYLIVVTGQYKGGPTGTERLYDELSFDLYYASLKEETIPPIIEPIKDPIKINDTINISVNASDKSGIQRVLVAYTDGEGEWKSKDLNKTGELWTCKIPINEISEFFVQAVDNNGNAAVGEERRTLP